MCFSCFVSDVLDQRRSYVNFEFCVSDIWFSDCLESIELSCTFCVLCCCSLSLDLNDIKIWFVIRKKSMAITDLSVDQHTEDKHPGMATSELADSFLQLSICSLQLKSLVASATT